MKRRIVNQKEITQLISGKKRVKLRNVSILTADVNCILGKDIIELYLKLNFCSGINWIDVNEKKLSTSFILINIFNLIKQLILLSFITQKVKKAIGFEVKNGVNKRLDFKDKVIVKYIRTDHWFNLNSGGSVGHTSGVINALIKKKVLHTVLSTSQLFNVNWKPKYTIQTPDYSKSGNVPNLSELNYNLELINTQDTSKTELDYNAIYQRYSLGNFYGIYLRRKYKIPLILEFNGSEVWVSKNWNNKKVFFLQLLEKIEKLNLELADKIVVVSEVLKNSLIETGVEANKILINPNGVDEDIYHPNIEALSLKKELGNNKKNIIGFIGTFGQWHGSLILAKSINEFYKLFPERLVDTQFLLIGEGNELAEVKKIVAASGFQENVTFTGKVLQSKGPEYLSVCNILLSPHIPNPDGSEFFGSPTKLFEYMAMGKAIIASDLNQIGEILEDKKTALLIEPNDYEVLAKTVNRLILDKELQNILGVNARIEVMENYTWDRHVEKLLKFVHTK